MRARHIPLAVVLASLLSNRTADRRRIIAIAPTVLTRFWAEIRRTSTASFWWAMPGADRPANPAPAGGRLSPAAVPPPEPSP